MILKGKKNHVFLLLLILVTIPTSQLSDAQKSTTGPNIIITTDKPSYIFGDTIVIYGTVKTVIPGNTIAVRILDPYSNLIQTGQPTLGQDGSYIYSIEISGSLWKTGGVYTVQVQYGPAIQTQTTFTYTATTAPITGTFKVQNPNTQQIFDIPYTIFGGSVTKMAVNPPNFSLTVSIHSINYGSITLSLPRPLLDARSSGGEDIPFTILVDGEQVTPQREQATLSDRALTIQFLQGVQSIQVIGTNTTLQNNPTNESGEQNADLSKPVSSVPEFPLATPMLIISTILVILLSMRIHFRFS